MRQFIARALLPTASAVAMFNLAIVPTFAINPQPLPPRSSSVAQVMLNPQPLPPRVAY